MNKNVTLICDLQFGSTGKGLIAGYLAKREKFDTVVTAWMPNAGHTFIDGDDRKFVHRQLANGIVSPEIKQVLIGPGSVIDAKILMEEIMASYDLLNNVKFFIHPQAIVLNDEHVKEEQELMYKIGSTKKGCGAALIDKIRRNPDKNVIARDVFQDNTLLGGLVCSREEYRQAINRADKILVEGAQGYSLGINSEFYPYTTSRECTPAQICSDTSIPIQKIEKIVGCMRTFPIRVANRYDENGKEIGSSGPGYPDQEEISFEDIGVEPEMTTVTKLKRRVFSFSYLQMKQAIDACQPNEVFLNFVNYLDGEGKIKKDIKENLTEEINKKLKEYDGKVRYWGWGPTENNIEDLYPKLGGDWGISKIDYASISSAFKNAGVKYK